MLNYYQTKDYLLRIIVSSLTGRYVAPEVFKNEEYDTKVDVFSFALILQEVIPIWNMILLDIEQCFHFIQVCHIRKK